MVPVHRNHGGVNLLSEIRRRQMVLVISLICFCVFMQLLGVPISLWDFNFEEDLLEISVSEGLTLVSTQLYFKPFLFCLQAGCPSQIAQDVLLAHSMFHPPCLLS